MEYKYLTTEDQEWILKQNYEGGVTMSTGSESPQSSSIVGYYKGFSVTITKRDVDAKVKPLIDEAMQAIDYMVEQGFKPSWNTETNKAVEVNTGRVCPKDGGKLISSVTKTGKKMIKCENNKWDPIQKKAIGCDYVEWAEMTNADM